MLEDGAWALADIGWCDRVQPSLARLLAAGGGDPPYGFYFGLHERSDDAGGGSSQTYFLDSESGTGCTNVIPHISPVMAMFCAGDHGMATGYVLDDVGNVGPVMTEACNRTLETWGSTNFQGSVCRTVELLAINDMPSYRNVDLRPVSVQLLRSFWQRPSETEALAWGKFSIHSDQDEGRQVPFAVSFEWSDVGQAFRPRTPPQQHPLAWPAAV